MYGKATNAHTENARLLSRPGREERPAPPLPECALCDRPITEVNLALLDGVSPSKLLSARVRLGLPKSVIFDDLTKHRRHLRSTLDKVEIEVFATARAASRIKALKVSPAYVLLLGIATAERERMAEELRRWQRGEERKEGRHVGRGSGAGRSKKDRSETPMSEEAPYA